MLKPMIIFIIGFFAGFNRFSQEHFSVYVPPLTQKFEFVDVSWSACEKIPVDVSSDNKFIIFLPNKYFSSPEEPRIIIDDYVNDKGFRVTKEQVEGDTYANAWRYTY